MAKKSALMISGWLYGLSAWNTSPVTGSVPAAKAWRTSGYHLFPAYVLNGCWGANPAGSAVAIMEGADAYTIINGYN